MSDWTTWKGGAQPVRDGQVFDARFSDGTVYSSASAWEWSYFFDEYGGEFDAEGDPYATAYRFPTPTEKDSGDGRG